VDLVHFAGAHAYDAARHDFESWAPKLSERAVVLFNNTAMRGGDYGVWRFWSEICQQFPHFEFLHGNGLGVLAAGEAVAPAIAALCGLTDASSVAAARSRFAFVGERWRSPSGAEARVWEKRAKEAERAREQIALRIDVARREVYAANLRIEEARSWAAATVSRLEQALAQAEVAVGQGQEAAAELAVVRAELEETRRERDALRSSTVWRATKPLRVVAGYMLPRVRRVLGGRGG
jgi:hypothetical protein